MPTKGNRDWQKDTGCKKGEVVQFSGNYCGGERNQITDTTNSLLSIPSCSFRLLAREQMRNVSAYLKIGSDTINIFCQLTGNRRNQG